MPLHWIYVIYTAVLALTAAVIVPRHDIRRLAAPSIVAGGIGDTILILVLGPLGLARYQAYGPFGFAGIPFFPPIAWTIFFIMYFYLLPVRTWLLCLYVAAAAIYSVLFANTLVNLDILWFTHRVMVPIFLYPIWFVVITYLFIKFFRDEGRS